jgi:competence protein ComEC
VSLPEPLHSLRALRALFLSSSLVLAVGCPPPDDALQPDEPWLEGTTPDAGGLPGAASPEGTPEATADAGDDGVDSGELPEDGGAQQGAGTLPAVEEPAPDGGTAGPEPVPGPLDGGAGAGLVRTIQRVASPALIPAGPPPQGSYRVHLIDVGTGLAVLVQGHDFTLLFDGGSSDDYTGISSGASSNRLLAYLWAAVGPSGPSECAPRGDSGFVREGHPERVLDYVFLSHAHQDHVSLLEDVLHCYRVKHVVEPGAPYTTAVYGDFVQKVAAESGTHYHTVAPVPDSRSVTLGTRTIAFPQDVEWTAFVVSEGAALGQGAHFQILHANGVDFSDPNRTSLVLRVDLGDTSLLLVGDAESGARAEPTSAPGDIEAYLLEHYPLALDVDLMQVGHHGSLTSSRLDFVRAVSPEVALIGAGPRKYGSVVLPDAQTVQTYVDEGATVLRTDTNDAACPEADRVGVDDLKPGGCDNWVITLAPGQP